MASALQANKKILKYLKLPKIQIINFQRRIHRKQTNKILKLAILLTHSNQILIQVLVNSHLRVLMILEEDLNQT